MGTARTRSCKGAKTFTDGNALGIHQTVCKLSSMVVVYPPDNTATVGQAFTLDDTIKETGIDIET